MPINTGMMSSKSSEWETPQEFFDRLHSEFVFTLDAAASQFNYKVEHYYSKGACALTSRRWDGTVWCNPPYGRVIGEFVKKAYEESQKPYCKAVVMLIPSRTDTRYWHDYVMKATEIRFVKGRLHFGNIGPAPFPSAIVVFSNDDSIPFISTITAK